MACGEQVVGAEPRRDWRPEAAGEERGGKGGGRRETEGLYPGLVPGWSVSPPPRHGAPRDLTVYVRERDFCHHGNRFIIYLTGGRGPILTGGESNTDRRGSPILTEGRVQY